MVSFIDSPFKTKTDYDAWSAMPPGPAKDAALASAGGSSAAPSKPAEEVVVVQFEVARETTASALMKIGWDAEDAALQADIMCGAEICGNNQGLVKMCVHCFTRTHRWHLFIFAFNIPRGQVQPSPDETSS